MTRLHSTRALASDRRGVALIEFAIVLPFLVLLLVGGYQLSDAVFAFRKVTATARTIADLTSQYQSVTDTDLDTILNASQQVLSPYKIASSEMRVTQVTINNGGHAKVDWSRAKNTTAYANNDQFAVSPNYKHNGATIIVADVKYHYVPIFASSLIGNIDLTEQVTMFPRRSTTITKN